MPGIFSKSISQISQGVQNLQNGQGSQSAQDAQGMQDVYTGAKKRIAIMVDSACDIPAAIVEACNIYVVPLLINYPGETYRDRVDIMPNEIYARMPEEIPSTSTPTPASVIETLEQIHADGYQQVIAVTIASALSSTFNLFRSVATGFSKLETRVFDSKSLAMGSGLIGIAATKLVQAGLSFEDVSARMRRIIDNTRAFFTPETLTYLYKGGRLSGTSYALGSMLDVRPVISSDAEGALEPLLKAKGRKQSLKKMLGLAKKRVEGFRHYNIAVVNSSAEAECAKFCATVCEELPNFVDLYEEEICPVLVTHGGPGLIGIAVQGIDEADEPYLV